MTEPAIARPLVSMALAAAVSGAVLWWLLAGIDRAALVAALGAASPWRLGVALLLVPLIQWLRAWRFELVLTGRPGLPSMVMVRVGPARALQLPAAVQARRAQLPSDDEAGLRHRIHALGRGILVVARGFDAGIAAALVCLAAGALLPEGAHGWSDPALIAAGAVLLVAPRALIRPRALKSGWQDDDRRRAPTASCYDRFGSLDLTGRRLT